MMLCYIFQIVFSTTFIIKRSDKNPSTNKHSGARPGGSMLPAAFSLPLCLPESTTSITGPLQPFLSGSMLTWGDPIPTSVSGAKDSCPLHPSANSSSVFPAKALLLPPLELTSTTDPGGSFQVSLRASRAVLPRVASPLGSLSLGKDAQVRLLS